MRLLRHVWAIYAVIVFLGLAIFFLPVLYLTLKIAGEKAFTRGSAIVRFWAKCYLVLFGMPWSSKGKHHFQPDQPYVIVSNHVSQLDILLCIVTIPIDFKFLSKKEAEKIPVIGYCAKQLHLLVDRSQKNSRAESMKKMVNAITTGTSVLIYPEGTRNKGPQLIKNFYDGAFRLAVKTQQPLLPMTILDDWKRQNGHMFLQLSPGRMRVRFDAPIPTQGMTEADIPALKAQVQAIMEGHLREVYGEAYGVERSEFNVES